MIAKLGCEVVKLHVPMKIDLKFGHCWGDAKHKWEEVPAAPAPRPAAKSKPKPPPAAPARHPDRLRRRDRSRRRSRR